MFSNRFFFLCIMTFLFNLNAVAGWKESQKFWGERTFTNTHLSELIRTIIVSNLDTRVLLTSQDAFVQLKGRLNEERLDSDSPINFQENSEENSITIDARSAVRYWPQIVAAINTINPLGSFYMILFQIYRSMPYRRLRVAPPSGGSAGFSE